MHGPIKVESPNNISKWQMGFNSAFKGLIGGERHLQTWAVLRSRKLGSTGWEAWWKKEPAKVEVTICAHIGN
jgi:hypothetical protein